jgi:hypothetical protein
MTPQKEKDKTYQPNNRFIQAEKMISQAIASMDEDNHVEYASSIERNTHSSKWKKWLHHLLRLR